MGRKVYTEPSPVLWATFPAAAPEVTGQRVNEEEAKKIEMEVETFQPNLILNQVRSRKDIEKGFSIRSACQKYFGIRLHYLGYVVYDQDVGYSVRRRRPLVLENAHSRAAQCVSEIASKLASRIRCLSSFNPVAMKGIDEQTYYEILEVNPAATSKEIQRAYEHAKETFHTDSLAVYSLFSEQEIQEIQVAIEEAYRVLTDETLRKRYDQSHYQAVCSPIVTL